MENERLIEVFSEMIKSLEKEIEQLENDKSQEWEKEVNNHLDMIISFKKGIEILKKK